MNDREIMVRLNATLNHIDASYAAIGKRYGLTFNALMMVYLIHQSQGMTQNSVCEELHLPKSTVHSILWDWIAKDYVRLVEGGNRKEKRIDITATGGAFFDRICSDTERIEKNVLNALGESECSALLKSADRFALLLQEEMTKDERDL